MQTCVVVAGAIYQVSWRHHLLWYTWEEASLCCITRAHRLCFSTESLYGGRTKTLAFWLLECHYSLFFSSCVPARINLSPLPECWRLEHELRSSAWMTRLCNFGCLLATFIDAQIRVCVYKNKLYKTRYETFSLCFFIFILARNQLPPTRSSSSSSISGSVDSDYASPLV